jgi:hypothetical protein
MIAIAVPGSILKVLTMSLAALLQENPQRYGSARDSSTRKHKENMPDFDTEEWKRPKSV